MRQVIPPPWGPLRVEVKVCPGLRGRAGWRWKGTQVEPQQGIKPGPEEDVLLRRRGAPSPKSLAEKPGHGLQHTHHWKLFSCLGHMGEHEAKMFPCGLLPENSQPGSRQVAAGRTSGLGGHRIT